MVISLNSERSGDSEFFREICSLFCDIFGWIGPPVFLNR
jgi:hypothetical protein